MYYNIEKLNNTMKVEDDKYMVALTKSGWKAVQLDNVIKLEKHWVFEEKGYKAEAFFGTMRNGSFTPTVIMKVYCQGVGTKEIIDDNCDVWKNIFTSTTKEEGNEYFKYLLKHGFKRIS